jgi:hypothetical protein
MSSKQNKYRVGVGLCVLLALPGLLTSCVVAGRGVVTAVESHYVADRKDVLSISGQTANHPMWGTFSVDDPPIWNKPYAGEDGATLMFTYDGTVTLATITPKDSEPQRYVFLDHGALHQANVYGIYWTVANPVEKKP